MKMLNYSLRKNAAENTLSTLPLSAHTHVEAVPKNIYVLAGQSEVTPDVATAEQNFIMDKSQKDKDPTKAQYNGADGDTTPGERSDSTSEISTDSVEESSGTDTSAMWSESRSSSPSEIHGTEEEHHKDADGKTGNEQRDSED